MTYSYYLAAAKADTVPEGRSGPWEITRHTITSMDVLMGALGKYGGGRGGSVREGQVITKLVHDTRGVIMSDSPDELRDMADLYSALNGEQPSRVLIHGLGLGCALRAVLACPTVTHVDLVELDPDVVALHGQLDPRVQLHVADAFTYQWPKGTTWDLAWHDVWDDLAVDNLADGPGSYARLNRRFARRVRWQAAWGQSWLQYQRDRDQRAGRSGYW